MQEGKGPLSSGPQEQIEQVSATNIVSCATKPFAARSEAAITYARNGWNVIPLHTPQGDNTCSCGESGCKIGKHPRLLKGWPKVTCDVGTVEAWWKQWPDGNVGLRLDGLVALDVDPKNGGFESLAKLEAEYGPLPQRARQRSGSGGWHYLFEAVPDIEKNRGFRPGLDFLTGNDCYIVVEPSVHATGGTYTWTDGPDPLSMRRDEIPLLVPPEWLLIAAAKKKPQSGTRAARPAGADRVPVDRIMDSALSSIKAGSSRNDAGFNFFCQLRDNGYSRNEAVQHVREWVAKANEAAPGQHRYTQGEADASLRQAYSRDARDPWDEGDGKPSQADILLKMCEDFEYFRSGPANDSYVRMLIGDHREVWPVSAKHPKVKEVLTHRFLTDKDRAPGREALNTAIDTVMAKCGMGAKVDVHVRFARSREAIFLDMCDDQWRAIEVTAGGWRVVDNPPVLFRRPSGARPLPVPVKGGTLEALRPLLNAGDDAQWCLMVAWLIGAFLPEGAFSHLVLEGEQGSAKSTTARVLQSLLDPSDAGLNSPPADERDATVAALHAGVLAFDNLSGCRAELADVFCRFSTGQGYRTRTLYENLDVTVANVKLPILLNGIDATIMRGDLLERSITLKLPRISPEHRRTEQAIWSEFAAAHPLALGALLDAVSTGLRNLPNTTLTDAPRMSDFCTWVVACEPALPWKPGQFISAYTRKLEDATRDLAENDSVAAALLEWADQHVRTGTGHEMIAKDLLIQLNDVTRDWPRDLRHWPSSPEALAHRLVRLAPVLRAHGIEVRRLPRNMKARSRWEIARPGPQATLPAFLLDDVQDTGDGDDG
jgi:hypothetical protein